MPQRTGLLREQVGCRPAKPDRLSAQSHPDAAIDEVLGVSVAKRASASIAIAVEEVCSTPSESVVSTENVPVNPEVAAFSQGTAMAFRNGQRSPWIAASRSVMLTSLGRRFVP